MESTRGQFDRDLDNIEAKVIALLGLIVEDLAVATQSLLGGNTETPAVLAGREQLIDSLYVEVENLAVRQIIMQAPVACDLRFLLTVLRVAPELERSHDLVVHIACRGSHLRDGDLRQRTITLAAKMSDLATAMWRQTADAWYERDPSAATSLGRLREEMDELRANLIAEAAAAPISVRAAMEMAQAARDYERLASHALNVARRVAYLAGSPGSPPAPI
jgi:phosphate transport system protein